METNEMNHKAKSKVIISILIAVIVIAVVLVILFVYIHIASQKTGITIQQENKLHLFSSPTLSFNFTNDFILINSTQALSSYLNSARLSLFYNGSQNNSIAITLVQNKTNTSAFSISKIYGILKQEFNTSQYSLTNLSILGNAAIKVLSDKPSVSYETIFINGPSGYYTGIFVDDNYSEYDSLINASINKILSTINFNYSSYLK
ncbi:hypothetical protein M1558_03375 [Candidatus Parvarchaeota archaeon]|nr:hypothetical protein [Candidatus Parvarchaeota archaeon]